MVTGNRFLAYVFVGLLSVGALPGAWSQSTGTAPSCASTESDHWKGSGLAIETVVDSVEVAEGSVVPILARLHNREASARVLSWAAGAEVYRVEFFSSGKMAVVAVQSYDAPAEGLRVEVPACGAVDLAPISFDTTGVLGSRSEDLIAANPTLKGYEQTGQSGAGMYLRKSTTASPPPPQPYSGSSGCENYLFVTVTTDRQWYRAGDRVTMSVYAYNSADRDVTIQYPSGQQYAFRLYDANENLVATLPADGFYSQAIVEKSMAPGERVGPYAETWTVPPADADSYASGTYFVEGVIATNPECSAMTTIYREYTAEPVKPTEPVPVEPQRPYEYYYQEYRWGTCNPREIDTADEWKLCYQQSQDRTLVVATDAYRYESGGAVTVTFGNPASEGVAPGPFVLVVTDESRNGVFKAEIPGVASLGPFQRARTLWDGRDDGGRAASGGYYIVAVYGSDGRYGETTVSYGGARVVFEYQTTPWNKPDYVWDDASYRRYALQYEGYGEKWLQLPEARVGDLLPTPPTPVEHEGELFGSLSCDGASATGRFLAFGYDSSAGGQINDFAVNAPGLGEASVVFTTVAIDGFVPATQPPAYGAANVGFDNPLCRGPVFLWFGEEQVVDVHNSPLAALGVRSATDSLVTFTLLETDQTRAEASRDGRRVHVQVGDVRGWLVLAGPGSLGTAGNVVIADLGAGGQVFFQVSPGGAGSDQREEILRGIAEGRVAGELNVEGTDGDTHDAPVLYHPGVTRFETIAATRGKVQLFIEAESSEGQVVVVNVDPRLLALGQGRTLRVLFDGEAATHARDFDDLVGGDGAKFLYLLGSEVVQVMVFIPHFSPHFITLESAVDLVTSPQFLQTLAITAGVAFLIVLTAAALAFRQPRPRP